MFQSKLTCLSPLTRNYHLIAKIDIKIYGVDSTYLFDIYVLRLKQTKIFIYRSFYRFIKLRVCIFDQKFLNFVFINVIKVHQQLQKHEQQKGMQFEYCLRMSRILFLFR